MRYFVSTHIAGLALTLSLVGCVLAIMFSTSRMFAVAIPAIWLGALGFGYYEGKKKST